MIEEIGFYDPRAKTEKGLDTFKVDADAARKWLTVGAQPSDTVRRLLTKAQIIDTPKDASNGD